MDENKQMLLIKTIRGKDEIVKANVYFTCHPEDFDEHFSTISKDIGGIHPCDVYYLNPELGDISTDEELMKRHEADMAEMQLVVVPITEKFLSDPGFSRDVDLPLAIKCKKPILPVMLGHDLLKLYNCNDSLKGLHYFNKVSHDSTALKYEEKLKRYIDAVLLNDEQYKSIGKEFSKHIFLSYRKVDRAFAREFMSGIHSMDGFRDVSIWYDEFLTPGEHYNDEILKKIKSSDLFAMIVTPNVTLRPNYIEKHEYRDYSRYCLDEEKDKNIIAAEFQDTDRKELEDTYWDFPQCIDAYDPELLREELKMHGIGTETQDNSARHLYLIGLAYLNGVEVEVDSEKAITLFTDAADMQSNEGSPQAMKQLSNMYYNGIGVKRAYSTAKSWQIKLVDFLKNRLEEMKDKKPGDRDINGMIIEYVIESMTLGDYCYEENDESNAETYYEDITAKVYGLTVGGPCPMDYIFNTEFFNQEVANGIWCDATRGATRLAKINYFNDYRDYTDHYNKVEREIEGRLNKFRNNTLFGTFKAEMDTGKHKDILKEEEEAVGSFLKEIDDLLAKQIENENYYKAEGGRGNFDKAIEYCLENVKINERLIELYETIEPGGKGVEINKKSLLAWYSRAGNAAHTNNSYIKAVEYLEKSLEIYDELGGTLDIFGCADLQLDIWIDYFDLGQSYAVLLDMEKSVYYLRKALDTCKEIYDNNPTEHWKSNLKKTATRLSQQESLLKEHNDFYSALKGFMASGERKQEHISEHVYTNEEAEKLSNEELAAVFDENMSKGDQYLSQRNYDMARVHYLNTLVTSRIIFNRTKKVSDLWNYSFASEGLGTVAMRQQRFEDCIRYYNEVADSCTTILKNVELEEARESLAKAYTNLGMAASKAGRTRKESHHYFDLGEKAWREAYKKYGKSFYYEKMKSIKDNKKLFR